MMEQIITLIGAILLIAGIIWWFFGKHESEKTQATVQADHQQATVVVKGGYSPATVVLKKGIPATINFAMEDGTACLSRVVFSQLGVDKNLREQKITPIQIPTDQAGEYDFACGMDMFHGKVVVK